MRARSVFINCPFDTVYLQLFRPLVFTVLYLGFRPRFALERADSGESRMAKIIELIRDSLFGIHDLSRCKSSKKNEFYRMNMPLELGYDLGAKEYGGPKWKDKKVLILEEHAYSIHRSVSDLSGNDCRAHENNPLKLVEIVRDWLVQEAGASPTGATSIWFAFNDFEAWNYDDLTREKWTKDQIGNMSMNELKDRMAEWIALPPLRH